MSNESTSGATAPVTEAVTTAGSVESSTQESTEQSNEASEAKHAVTSANKKKFKIKIDGNEEDYELDLNNEDEIKRHLQMSKAAQKRMQEAAESRKQAENFIKMLQKDPVKVLTNPQLGVDFRKLAEEYLVSQLQDEMMTPEEKQLRKAEQIIKEREQEEARQKEELQSKQMRELQNHYAQDYDRKITEALSTSGLPKTPKTVNRMAELMYKNLQNGLDLEPSQLVEIVREDYINEIRELFGATEGDKLLNIMGEDVANKIRKADLARLMGSNSNYIKPGSGSKDSAPAASSRSMSKDEWREMIAKRARE